MFNRVVLAGLGLLGSSFGHALRRGDLAREIVGLDQNADHCAQAERLGFVDRATTSPTDAVAGADLVVLCTPVGAMGALAEVFGPALAPGAIVTDVGSVKGFVAQSVAPHIPAHAHFIPGHPVAGTEQSGPAAGFAELFDGRWCILTPLPDADADALARLKALWEAMGSQVECMTPEHHDRVLAITSHLPHLIAYTIVGTASDLEEVTESEVMTFSAGGFRDFTRIAASDPVMWRDVFLTNSDAVLELLGRFTEDLIALQRAIRWKQGDHLHDQFERARAIRQGILELGQDTAAPDFGRHHGRDPEDETDGG